MGPVFNEPTNEFRIPHKWQAEMDAQARGKVVEASSDGGKTWMKPPCGRWKFDGDVDMLYRIKPKTVKTRLRVALMGDPGGCSKTWILDARDDGEAERVAHHPHFIKWLGDWHEIVVADKVWMVHSSGIADDAVAAFGYMIQANPVKDQAK